ncbi:MAG TPA: hypothetical protein VKU19_31195 [Bryobacteraceae bacterium]|nr:hypothetical protein [Bryobacteraceae bacterium]
MFRQQSTRFLYKAHAVGAAGTFTKPHAEHMEAQASCAMALHGGKSTGFTENFNHRNIVRFRTAYSQTLGSYRPPASLADLPLDTREDDPRLVGSWNSLVTTEIQGLNIHSVVTCDRLVARFASHHFEDGREATFQTLGSYFENLKVGGQLVDFELDNGILTEWDTHSKAATGCLSRKPYRISADGQRIYTSIVKHVKWGKSELPENVIQFPDFGSIHLGEIMISSAERRLVMLRVEFGCEVEGDGNFGDVGGNGHTYP